MATTLNMLPLLISLLLFILAFLPQHHQAFSNVQLPSATTGEMQPQSTAEILYGVSEGSLRPQECGGRCTTRCSKTSFKKPCLFFCQKCCAKCLCVPAGTYGNKQTCPCYNNWKTKRGGPKCP